MDFPKICTRAPVGPSAYLKQISDYFPANNSNSDDKRSRQRQHRHSAAAAQHKTRVAIATLNPATASLLVYHEPEVVNLRAQHHQQRWRRSEASRSRGAACLYELLLEKEPLFSCYVVVVTSFFVCFLVVAFARKNQVRVRPWDLTRKTRRKFDA